MKKSWWKVLAVILLLYTFTAGFLIRVPHIGNLYGSIRNFFFHVPMWIAMMVLFSVSVIYAIKYLRHPSTNADIISKEYAKTGIIFGVLGLVSGSIWASYTWGEAWSNDPKQVLTVIALLIYAAYFILRNSIPDFDKRGKVGAVYNVFAFAISFPTIYILPRMVDSLHPGGKGVEGNPALGGANLDAVMAKVFVPACIGWTLLSIWVTTLKIRFEQIKEKQHENVLL